MLVEEILPSHLSMDIKKFGKAFALAGALGLSPEAAMPKPVKQEMSLGQEQLHHGEVDSELVQSCLDVLKERVNTDPALHDTEVRVAELRFMRRPSDSGELVFRAILSNGEEQQFYGDDLATANDSANLADDYVKSLGRNLSAIIDFVHGKRPDVFAPMPRR
jgi:hypothetical protein